MAKNTQAQRAWVALLLEIGNDSNEHFGEFHPAVLLRKGWGQDTGRIAVCGNGFSGQGPVGGKLAQVLDAIDPDSRNRYYGADTANENDFHTAYYGLITAAYIIE